MASLRTILKEPNCINMVAILNLSNNYSIQCKITPPVQNIKYFRVISSVQAMIWCDFADDAIEFTAEQYGKSTIKFQKVLLVGQDETYYFFKGNELNRQNIYLIQDSIFLPPPQSIEMVFQFITTDFQVSPFLQLNRYISGMRDSFSIYYDSFGTAKQIGSQYRTLNKVSSYKYMTISCDFNLILKCSWKKAAPFFSCVDGVYELDEFSQNVVTGNEDLNVFYCNEKTDLFNDTIECDSNVLTNSATLTFNFYSKPLEILKRRHENGTLFAGDKEEVFFSIIIKKPYETRAGIFLYEQYEQTILRYFRAPYNYIDCFLLYHGQRIYLSKLQQSYAFFNELKNWNAFDKQVYQLYYVRSYQPEDRMFYNSQQQASYTPYAMPVLPMYWLSKELISTSNCQLIRAASNVYTQVFSCARKLISYVNPSQPYNAYASLFPSKLSQNGIEYGPKINLSDLSTLIPSTSAASQVVLLTPFNYDQIVFYLSQLVNSQTGELNLDELTPTIPTDYYQNLMYAPSLPTNIVYFILDLIRIVNQSSVYEIDTKLKFFLGNPAEGIVNILTAKKPIIGNTPAYCLTDNVNEQDFYVNLISEADLVLCNSNVPPQPDPTGTTWCYFSNSSYTFNARLELDYSAYPTLQIPDKTFDVFHGVLVDNPARTVYYSSNYILMWTNGKPNFSQSPFRTSFPINCVGIQKRMFTKQYKSGIADVLTQPQNFTYNSVDEPTNQLCSTSYGKNFSTLQQFQPYFAIDYPLNAQDWSVFKPDGEYYTFNIAVQLSDTRFRSFVQKRNYTTSMLDPPPTPLNAVVEKNVFNDDNFAQTLNFTGDAFNYQSYLGIDSIVKFQINFNLQSPWIVWDEIPQIYDQTGIPYYRSNIINLSAYLFKLPENVSFLTFQLSGIASSTTPITLAADFIVYKRRECFQILYTENQQKQTSIWGNLVKPIHSVQLYTTDLQSLQSYKYLNFLFT